jgi:hypothetical protein
MTKLGSKNAQVIFIIGWVLILFGILVIGWDNTWSALALPTMTPEFADMRTVQGALLSLSDGFNPQIKNPGDPWDRQMNYPSAWISIAKTLSLQHEANYLVFIYVMLFLFLGCCFLLVKQHPSVTLLLMCFSGATLLAVERGNNDILIFVLLYVASLLPSIGYRIAIFVAILLKIYPIVAIPAYIRSFRDIAVMIIIVLVAGMILLPEISEIRYGIPVSPSFSYGLSSILVTASQIANAFEINSVSASIVAFGVSAMLISLSFAIASIPKLKKRLLTTSASPMEIHLFLIGGCVYVGTFILSSNWDYRLIFLLFCVPYVTKLDDNFFRFGLCLLLICALNYIFLYAAFGLIGIGINILSKIILFIIFAAMIYLELRYKLLKIYSDR